MTAAPAIIPSDERPKMMRILLRSLGKTFALSGLCLALLSSCGGDSPEALVKSAKDYMAKRDYSAAVIQLRTALQKDPESAEARYLLGASLNDNRDPVGAEKELRKALELGYPPERVLPALARALVAQGEGAKLIAEFGFETLSTPEAQAEFKTFLGDASLALGQTKDAEAAFNAALAAKSDFPLAQVGLATLRATNGDIAGANALLDAALVQSPSVPEGLLLKGQLLLAQDQPDAARGVLEKAVEANPDYLPARYVLAALFIKNRDFDQATAQVAAIRKVSKQDARSYYFEALIAYEKNEFAPARDAIQQVIKAAPNSVPGLVLAGQIEYRAKQFNQSQDYLRRALALAPGLVYAQRMLAATYLRTGSPGRAIELLEPTLSRGSKDPLLLALAGEAYLANGDYPRATQYFEQTASLDSKNAGARTRLGELRFAAGDSEGAIRDLEAASQMDPKLSAADMALIANLVRRQQFDQALAAVGKLEKKQPNSALLFNLKGVIYMGKKDVASARKSFEQAVIVEPTYFPAIFNLTRLDLLDKNPDAARKRFDAVLEKEPNNESALLGLANFRQLQGADATEIESLLKRAVAANPQSIPPRVALVQHYARRGDSRQALLAAQEAAAALPNDPGALELLGEAQLATGEPKLARETFAKLVAAQPQSTGALLQLARTLAVLKDYDKAIEALRSALAINNSLPEAKREIVAIYAASGRPEIALREIKTIQRQQPDDSAGYLLEGDLWASQKKWSEAEIAYRAALKRAPANAMAAVKLHASMINAGKAVDADTQADKWTRDHPEDITVRAYLGERAIQKKDYKTAVRHLQAAIAQRPDNAIVLNNLAWAAGQLSDPKAITYAERAYALAPTSPEILDTFGMLLVKKGDVPQALERLQDAARRAPNRSEIRLDFAKVLIAAGKKVEARRELEALVQASNRPTGAATDDKGSSVEQKSAGQSASATRPLTCGTECAAEATALLKTL